MKFSMSSASHLSSISSQVLHLTQRFIEQDEVIERLRKENETVNYRYSIALKLVVGISCILYVTKLCIRGCLLNALRLQAYNNVQL